MDIDVHCFNCNQDITIRGVDPVGYVKWKEGLAKIQDALPTLSEELQVLLVSGLCGSCFDALLNGGAMNQCDGCHRGLPLNDAGIHFDPASPCDLIGCTRDRYEDVLD